MVDSGQADTNSMESHCDEHMVTAADLDNLCRVKVSRPVEQVASNCPIRRWLHKADIYFWYERI